MSKGQSVDVLMKKIFVHLVGDFRKTLGVNYATGAIQSLLNGVKSFRNYKFPSRSTVCPVVFKRDYQLETFFKRYRFEDDVYTTEQLHEMSVEKFIQTQMRLDGGIQASPLVNRVLRGARAVAKEILGDYSLSEHQQLCRFGKRACVGSPYSSSTLDEKLSRPLTGSLQHIRWFKDYLKSDELLRLAIREASGKRRPSYMVCSTLTLTHVPKSYKSLRAICPDTLLGSFYTAGLGRLIAEKLTESGLNIRKLQRIHGILALESSISRVNVTADLSAASDSLTGPLLMKVLPLPWYRAVMCGRIPTVKVGNTTVRMNTVLTMGLGHTFPLQTLVFYSLLESIRRLAGIKGRVSVYGDDLIYPRKIHHYVEFIFPKLQLLLNGDKTYAQDFFRESCGSDFYRGCDVRPFCFEGEHNHISGTCYEELLYKLYNGLCRRWDPAEIAGTLEFVQCELILHADRILCVPPDFPDHSGIKGSSSPNGYFEVPLSPCYPYQSSFFHYLRSSTGRRRAISQCIYYWEKLRQNASDEEYEPYSQIQDEPILYWTKSKKEKVTAENGTVYARLVPQTAAKRDAVISLARSSTTMFDRQLHLVNHTVKDRAAYTKNFVSVRATWLGRIRFARSRSAGAVIT